MIGYIYLTKNNINDKLYIGKHTSPEYDQYYYGSGVQFKKDLKKYGKENFTNLMFEKVDGTLEDLNNKEKEYIQTFRNIYPEERLYNVNNGGEGGDRVTMMPEDQYKEFVEKMTIINRERCRTEEFREAKRKLMKERITNDKEFNEKTREGNKKYWETEEAKEKQRKHLQNLKDRGIITDECKYRPCSLSLNGEYIEFKGVGELKQYLKDGYGIVPTFKTMRRLFDTGEPYIALTPKCVPLNGMIIKRIENK